MPIESIKGTSGLVRLQRTIFTGSRVGATERYEGTESDCIAGLKARGYWGTGLLAGFQVVDSDYVNNGDDQKCILTIKWEWSTASGIPLNGTAGTDLPPDSYSVTFERGDVPIERIGRYAPLVGLTVTTDKATDQDLIGLIRSAAANPYEYKGVLDDSGAALTTTQKDLAKELYDHLVAGMTMKMAFAPVYRWTHHHWFCPVLTSGGFVTSNPSGPGAAILPPLHEWLRMPDELNASDSHFTVESKWMGMPDTADDGSPGGWTAALYPHE